MRGFTSIRQCMSRTMPTGYSEVFKKKKVSSLSPEFPKKSSKRTQGSQKCTDLYSDIINVFIYSGVLGKPRNRRMLQNMCELRHSGTSIDVHEKLILKNGNSPESSVNTESVCASENFNGKVIDVSSESSLKSHPSPSDKEIFRAPPGVTPYHVKWSRIRRKSGGQRLIFVWPQKNIARGSCLGSLVPLVRRILIGLVYLGAIHIWPGEFLPTSVPSTVPLPKIPVKCSVIEPLWEEDDRR